MKTARTLHIDRLILRSLTLEDAQDGRIRCASTAAKSVAAYSFEVLKLNRIHAKHFKRNAASARVLEKIWMRYEG